MLQMLLYLNALNNNSFTTIVQLCIANFLLFFCVSSRGTLLLIQTYIL